MTILSSARDAPWAILSERLDEMLTIAERLNVADPQVLEAYRAAQAERGERLKVRDGIGILDVTGPLFKRANLFVNISGATSYEILRRDFQAALDDPSISGIMLRVDSPGGEANGCDELATAIYEARGKKPIHAYVSGMACSGGYWLASAADKIIVSESAILGSIGVVLGVTDRTAADEKTGVLRREFVSSNAPGKRPDMKTDAGSARIQKMVDDLGDVFAAAVARHRGVDAETVVEKFGAGGVEIGANAVSAGMADSVGQFEAALAALSTSGSRRTSNRSEKEYFMTNTTTGVAADTVDANKIRVEALAEGENKATARISAILSSDAAKTRMKQANHIAFKTKMPADEAVVMLEASAEETPAAPDKKDTEASYIERKTEAGTLGLGKPDSIEASEKSASDGWAKAVARANSRFE